MLKNREQYDRERSAKNALNKSGAVEIVGPQEHVDFADSLFKKGEYAQAAFGYEQAFLLRGSADLEIGRKMCKAYMRAGREKEVLAVLSDLIQKHEGKGFTGDDFAMYAASIYAYFTDGQEDYLDEIIQDCFNYSARQLLLNSISTARQLGTDLPEFKEMEAYAKKKKGGLGGLFKRRK